ncbi:Glutathione S-transferase protein, partial [Trichostrongylus colubriformis]
CIKTKKHSESSVAHHILCVLFCSESLNSHNISEGYSDDTRLPVLIVDDQTKIIGVNEISRFVATRLNLYGDSHEDRQAIDDVLTKLEDLHIGLAPTIRATLTRNYEERRDVWNHFKTTALFPCLVIYEKELGSRRHLVGSRISWADIALIEMLTRFQWCYDSFYLAHFPKLKEYCDRFEALPHLRPYIQSRPNTHF